MKKILSAVITVLALGLPVQVQAYSITIDNASFEDPPTSGVIASPPTDWTEGGTGGTGVWNIDVSPDGYWTVGAPEGDQIAFLSDAPAPGSPSTLSQVLGDTVAANTTYTLSGSVGHPIGYFTTYTVSLYAGATLVGSDTGAGPQGFFDVFTVIYDSSLTPLLVGETLRIELGSASAQTGFDDLTLEAQAIPDGGLTVLLLGMSMAGLGWMRRKRA